MNPAELKLIQNLNTRIEDLTLCVKNLQKQVTIIKDFAKAEADGVEDRLTLPLAALTSLTEDFTPYVCKVNLPEHLRGLMQANIMDFVDDAVGIAEQPKNPYPVEHDEKVLVLSGITNKKGEVVAVNEAGRLLWPLPKTIFDRLL